MEILNGFRLVGINALSLFMDLDAYRKFSRFGVNVDKSGNELTSRPPNHVKKLEAGENALYLALCSPGWDGSRCSCLWTRRLRPTVASWLLSSKRRSGCFLAT